MINDKYISKHRSTKSNIEFEKTISKRRSTLKNNEANVNKIEIIPKKQFVYFDKHIVDQNNRNFEFSTERIRARLQPDLKVVKTISIPKKQVDLNLMAHQVKFTNEFRSPITNQVQSNDRKSNSHNLDTLSKKDILKDPQNKYDVKNIQNYLNPNYEVKRRHSFDQGQVCSQKLKSNSNVIINYEPNPRDETLFHNCKLCSRSHLKELEIDSNSPFHKLAKKKEAGTLMLNALQRMSQKNQLTDRSYTSNEIQITVDEHQNDDQEANIIYADPKFIQFREELARSHIDINDEDGLMLFDAVTHERNLIRRKFIDYLKNIRLFCKLQGIKKFDINMIQNRKYSQLLLDLKQEIRQSEINFKHIVSLIIKKYRYEDNLICQNTEIKQCSCQLKQLDQYKLSLVNYKHSYISYTWNKQYKEIDELNNRYQKIMEKFQLRIFKKKRHQFKSISVDHKADYQIGNIMRDNKEKFGNLKGRVKNLGKHVIVHANKKEVNPSKHMGGIVLNRSKSAGRSVYNCDDIKMTPKKHDCIHRINDLNSISRITTRNKSQSHLNTTKSTEETVKTNKSREIMNSQQSMKNNSNESKEVILNSLKTKVFEDDQRTQFLEKFNCLLNKKTNLYNLFKKNIFI